MMLHQIKMSFRKFEMMLTMSNLAGVAKREKEQNEQTMPVVRQVPQDILPDDMCMIPLHIPVCSTAVGTMKLRTTVEP